jgi:phosphoserine phosphatase RsbU/P
MMPRILVVDDEPDVAELIRQRFRHKIRNNELSFVFAHNGVEALETLRQDPGIDMILTDINMPQMDGLTLLDQLDETNPMLKAVVVSAYGDMKNIRTAMNRGAFDFVTKPINFDDLEVTIAKTLKYLHMIRDALAARDHLVAIHHELEVAAHIQQALLPTGFHRDDNHEIFATMHPAKDVAGDFYDFFEVAPGRLGFAVADVSGKGMAAALFMAVSRTLLRAGATNNLSPGPCLSQVNRLLCADNTESMFVTLFYGVLDTRTGEVIYANGGHCAPYLLDADGSVSPVEITGDMALGVVDDLEYVEKRVTLGVGGSLFLYTDGVTEAFDDQGRDFGSARLIENLRSSGSLDPAALLRKITDGVKEFAGGATQSDDITCLAIRRNDDVEHSVGRSEELIADVTMGAQ